MESASHLSCVHRGAQQGEIKNSNKAFKEGTILEVSDAVGRGLPIRCYVVCLEIERSAK